MTDIQLTRGLRRLIKEKVNNHLQKGETLNRLVLMSDICLDLGDRFQGDQLDYQCARMGIRTTNDVLNAVDNYIFKYFKWDFKNI